jgi:cGMP-dependent protein kinase
MKVGEFFGERALVYDEPRSATIVAFGAVTCLSLSRDTLFLALGGSLLQIVHFNTMRMIIEKSAALKTLLPT